MDRSESELRFDTLYKRDDEERDDVTIIKLLHMPMGSIEEIPGSSKSLKFSFIPFFSCF